MKDNSFIMADGLVFQARFYCTSFFCAQSTFNNGKHPQSNIPGLEFLKILNLSFDLLSHQYTILAETDLSQNLDVISRNYIYTYVLT